MKEMSGDGTFQRGYLNSRLHSTISTHKPPKPPCWQDFITNKLSNTSLSNRHGSIATSSSESDKKKIQFQQNSDQKKHKSSTKSKSSKIASQLRINLKRTRSEPCIADQEIPPDAAIAGISDVHLHLSQARNVGQDLSLYLEENYRKCSQWLDSVEPLKCDDSIDQLANSLSENSSVNSTGQPSSERPKRLSGDISLNWIPEDDDGDPL